ncbi:P protein [Drosophila mojavensis]|uniref:Citrate transporter-like domain-containing protein n=1 Tax=Drosophila mojavensis TaxID=7230 RepID=B4KHT5_DROMO|nr:P protein [Drosophila mojavensis]XP_032585130.1 P protein [Drosophila mojavensis]EDW13372.1 uncharacterized protein Dmoj_GI18174 [Drosophila mojavensis]
MDTSGTYKRRGSYFDDEELELTPEQERRRRIRRYIALIIKMVIFLIMWIFFVVNMCITSRTVVQERVVALEQKSIKYLDVTGKLKNNKIKVMLNGNFDKEVTNYPRLAADSQKYLSIRVRIFNINLNRTEQLSENWTVYLMKYAQRRSHLANVQKLFKLTPQYPDTPDIAALSAGDQYKIQVILKNSINDIFALKIKTNISPVELVYGVVAAGILLCSLYAVIILDITDPTFAAVLITSCAIGVLCIFDELPSMRKILSWIDIHTLALLFGMMIIVSIISETGVFGYIAVLAYRLSKGRAWLLVGLLCLISVILAGFLELVTILMIMVPVVIRLCECMSLRTTTVLICVAIFSNIGCALTPIGDPPTVLIATNAHVMSKGVDFSMFFIHMFPGVVLSLFAAWTYIYLILRKSLTHGAEEQTNNSLRILAKRMGEGRAPPMMSMPLANPKLSSKKYSETTVFRIMAASNYIETLAMMESKYKVQDKPLLIKCAICFLFAIVLWLLHSLPFFAGATLSWTALMASMLLLILYDSQDLTAVFMRIDWSMLLFFSALFVLIEVCAELGLIHWLAELAINIIANVDPQYQVVTSIMVVLWISAALSIFIENIPIATMLLRLTIQVALSERINIPLVPLVWALTYAICFGGNGSLYSTTANVAASSIANQHGYKITFYEFFKYGFPIMIITNSIASLYLLIAHGIFQWH